MALAPIKMLILIQLNCSIILSLPFFW